MTNHEKNPISQQLSEIDVIRKRIAALEAEQVDMAISTRNAQVEHHHGHTGIGNTAGTQAMPDDLSDMKEITFDHLARIWLAFFWRAALVGLGIGFVLGLLAGFVMALAGVPQAGAAAGALMGWLAGIPASFIALRSALMKNYTGFSLKLMKLNRPQT